MEERGENSRRFIELVAGFAPGRPDLAAGSLMLLSILIFFSPSIFRGEVFFLRDICMEIVPKRWFLAASGPGVLWNPHSFFGLPMAANSQSSVFYPLNFIFYLGSTPEALTFYIILHFALGLFFTYLLARSLGCFAPASLAGALAFAYGGFFISSGSQVVVLNSAVWIMPLLWSAHRAYLSGRRGFTAAAGMCWGLQVLGGEPEIAFLSGLVLMFFFAGIMAAGAGGHSLKQSLMRTARIVLPALVIALCLSAVQWLLTLELSGLSNRAGGLSFEEAVKWSLEPRDLLSLVSPNYFMDPASKWWALGFRNSRLPYLLSIYPGIVALVIALIGVSGRRMAVVFLGGAAFFILLSLGPFGGVYRVFFQLLPGFDRFRIPEHCMYGFAALLAPAVSLGMTGIFGRGAGGSADGDADVKRRRTAALAAVLMPAAMAAALILWLRPVAEPVGKDDYYAYHLLLLQTSTWRSIFFALAFGFVLVLPGVSRRVNAAAPWALCAILFLDLFCAHRHVNPTVPSEFYSLAGNIAEGLPGHGANERALVLAPARAVDRTLGAGRDVVEFYRKQRTWLRPFTGLELLLDDAGSRSSFYPADVDVWNELIAQSAPEAREKFLSAAGVKWVLRPGDEPLSVAGALPRAFVVPEARWFTGRDQALAAMAGDDFDPRQAALLEGTPPSRLPPRLANIFWPMRIVNDRNQQVTIMVEPGHPGYLVLLDSFYPGWTARINGRTVPVYRANGFFRAVAVGPEGGKVEFTYRPTLFLAGLVLSLLTLLACAAYLVRGRLGGLWWAAWIIVLGILPMIAGGTTWLPVTLLRIMAVAMCAAWAWTIGRASPPRFYRTSIDLWLVCFWIVAAVSMMRSNYFYISAYWYLNIFTFILIFYFTVQFTAGAGERPEARVNTLFHILMAAYLVHALWALAELASGSTRHSGGFFNQSYLAGGLMAVSPYALSRFLLGLSRKKIEWGKVLGFGALFIVFCPGVLATQSRAIIIWPLPLFMVGLPGIHHLLTARGIRPPRAWRMSIGGAMAALVLLCACLAIFPNPLKERISTLKRDPYAFERVKIWRSGLEMVKDHPLGVGPGMFKYFFYRYAFPVEKVMAGRFEKRANTAHNEYINLAAEMSPAAPLLLIIPGLWLLGAGWRRGRGSPRESEILGASAAVTAIMLHALFDSNLHNPSIAVLAAVFGGVLFTELSRTGGGFVITLDPGRAGKWVIRAVLTALLLAGVLGYSFLGFGYARTFHASSGKDPGRVLLQLVENSRYAAGNALHFKNMASAYLLQYRQLGDVKDLSDSIKAAETAISLNPEDPASFGLKAESLLELGRVTHEPEILRRARSSFLDAGKLSPFDIDYLLGLAEVERMTGNGEAGIGRLHQALALEPYDLGARLKLIQALLDQGGEEEASAQFKEFGERRREINTRLAEKPEFFNPGYRKKRITFDPAELMMVEQMLKKAGKSTGPKSPEPPREEGEEK